MSQAYQRGSIRRVHRLRGDDVWEWRYRVPISAALVKALKEYKPRVKSEWLFPSRITGGPRSADMILKDYIRPAIDSAVWRR